MSIAKISKIINLGTNREEYFENPVQDYFNIEKKSIRVLMWKKKWNFVRQTPENYWPAGSEGFILLNGYNCQARCQYCYLQSYFKSPDIIRFVNTEDFLGFLENFIKEFRKKNPDKKLIFYDWDFKDSLGYYWLEQNINNINALTELCAKFPDTLLEIRTKNVLPNFDLYKDLILRPNLIVSITFSPQNIIDSYEQWSSNLNLRLDFAKYISSLGWDIGIRIDPIIFDRDFDNCWQDYFDLIEEVNLLKSIINYSIWTLRLKTTLYKALKKKQSNIINNLVLEKNFRRYPLDMRNKIYTNFEKNIKNGGVYICMDE